MTTKPLTSFPVGLKVSLRKYFQKHHPDVTPSSYTGVVIGLVGDFIQVKAPKAQEALARPASFLCYPNELSRAQGFAAISPERQLAAARKGGRSVPAEKRAFSSSHDLAQRAGSLGGKIGGKSPYKNSRGAGSHE